MVGVELDPTTARITRLLYPSADIRAEGFESTRLPDGSFVGAVGNVPFGKITLHDPTYNRRRHSIHNHFITRSLRMCAPGGMVGLVTSRYTMDAANPAARREMAELADLVGAIRLPTGAMRRVAGTDVVCDLPGSAALPAGTTRPAIRWTGRACERVRLNAGARRPNRTAPTSSLPSKPSSRIASTSSSSASKPASSMLRRSAVSFGQASDRRMRVTVPGSTAAAMRGRHRNTERSCAMCS
jgi:hypothetical protein